MKEITINPKNLLYHILLRWRLMILLAVIFAVLANCFGIYQSYTAKKKAAALAASLTSPSTATADPKESEDLIEKKENAMTESGMKLTSKELYDVDSAIDTYQLFSSQYAEIDAYLKNSVLMQIDAQRVPTLSIQYYVNDYYVVEYPVIEKRSYAAAVVSTYIATILDETTINAIAEACGTTPEYASELISVYDKGLFLCIDIMGKDEETCNAAGDIIKKRISDLRTAPILTSFGKYDITLTSEQFSYVVNTELYDKQLKKITDRNTVRTARVNVTTGMNDAQKQYLLAKMDYLNAISGGDSYVSTYTVGDNDEEETSEETEETVTPAPPKPVKIKYFDVKLVLAGFLGGILIGFFIALLSYTLTPVVRVNENISDGFKQIVLGTVWLDGKKKKFLGVIDRLITKWFYGREVGFELSKRIEMLCAGIQIAMEKEGIQNVYLTGASEKGNEIIEQLKENLKDSCNVVSGESVIYNPASLKTLSESESVVFVETAGDSRYEEIAKEIEVAGQSKVKVLGFVLLQQ